MVDFVKAICNTIYQIDKTESDKCINNLCNSLFIFFLPKNGQLYPRSELGVKYNLINKTHMMDI